MLATQFGAYAAGLVADEHYGVTVAMVNRHVTANPLADIAGKTRGVPGDCDMLNVARAMGICLGNLFVYSFSAFKRGHVLASLFL